MIPAGTPLGAVRVRLGAAPVIGEVAPGGQHVKLGKLVGWWDAAASSGQATQKVNAHGAFLGPAFYGPRVVQAEARIDGFSPGDSMSLARRILTELDVSSLTSLSVEDEEGTLTAAVRQEGDPILIRTGNRVIVSLSMLAPDPRRYGPVQQASTGLPVSTGGFMLPITLPVSTGGSTVSGAVDVFNDGDTDSDPAFTVTGPLPGFTITDQEGRQLSYAEALPAARSVIIDTGKRTALLDGVATRVVTGTWPVVRPGLNQFRFASNAYDAAAQMLVSYQSARR